MPFKARVESEDLKRFKILDQRMLLTADEKKYYKALLKGYEGEVQFDSLTEKLQSDSFILNDLVLEVNHTKFQIDSTIIFQNTYHFFEVKNYEGDYIYDPENFKSGSGKPIQNPLDQLKRSKTLIRQLLQNLGYNLQVEGHVIFINPEFTLLNAPYDLSFIYPSQLNRFLKKLDMKPSRLNNIHIKLANQLVALHQSKVSMIKLPTYEYDQLKKGLNCKGCDSFSVSVQGKKQICNECGYVEMISTAVLRSVEEYKLLFPNWKINSNIIFDWCGGAISKRRIGRTLGKSLKIVGVHQWAVYE
ncbi:NERD domain-containing protein [Bacillus salipaludis]|uniref:NERD domain-containing protein n=1 Tax=Bacillus salipaludis TaxID=2547811 RepID=A0A4V3ATK6_9BACI|nr:nuclease-related domain-containing protein [Bacillus salipaludis]MDQ6599291.1 nuclease-related domain-containing protein [Bacillus salipaludis]TDK60423.1 NERD domain-containing protein [Bacillus salipaludis]